MTVYAEVQKPTISSQPDQARSPAGRIQAELHLLGYEIAESTVAKYRVRSHKPPSQTWKSFLRNHAGQIAAIDFFTVPTDFQRVVLLRAAARQETGGPFECDGPSDCALDRTADH